jgi:hypothetical protein
MAHPRRNFKEIDSAEQNVAHIKHPPKEVVTRNFPNVLQLLFGGRRKPPSHKLSGLQTCEGGDAEKEDAEDTKDYNAKGVLFQPHHSRRPLWWRSEAGQRNSSSLRHIRWQWQVPPQWNPGFLQI